MTGQARELLTAVIYVGRPWRGRHLRAFFACMYFAALRPGEVKALRKDGCYLPVIGWGKLTLSRSRPQSNKRWTDSGEALDDRGLKHRAENDTRSVPIPPELVMILREHIEEFGPRRIVNGQVAVPAGGQVKVPTPRVDQVLFRVVPFLALASRMR